MIFQLGYNMKQWEYIANSGIVLSLPSLDRQKRSIHENAKYPNVIID